MGFEIPIDVDYFEHPKTLRLKALIGPTADVYPLRLWAWAAQYAKDGILKGGAPEVEAACRWRGGKGRLANALREVGYLERDGKSLHGWLDATGHAIRIYEHKKQLQRLKYARENGILPEEFSKKRGDPGYSGDSGDSGNPGEERERRRRAASSGHIPEESPPILDRNRTPQEEIPTEAPQDDPEISRANEVEPDPDNLHKGVTAARVAQAYRECDLTVPLDKVLEHVRRAGLEGISYADQLEAVVSLRTKLKIWTILDRLRDRKKTNGTARLLVGPKNPEYLKTSSEEAHKRQDEARAAADAALAKMAEKEPEELAAWQTEIEGQIPAAVLNESTMKGALRIRAAKKFGIEGV